MTTYPTLVQTVLDTPDVRTLAEFYRELLGWTYREGDEPPADGPDEPDWLVLRDDRGSRGLAFQQVERLEATTWPDDDVPMQLHLDLTVPDVTALEEVRALVESLGCPVASDRTDDPDEPLYVFRDPAGHPFCVFVG